MYLYIQNWYAFSTDALLIKKIPENEHEFEDKWQVGLKSQ